MYVNSVRVQAEKIITPADLGVAVTTAPFTLASVNAKLGLGADNIMSLRGINYNAEGGGNWMGIDYVKLDTPGSGEPLKFTSSTVSGGKVNLTWTGIGNLQWAPSVSGPWTAISPAPTSPYSENLLPGAVSRFYRLQK